MFKSYRKSTSAFIIAEVGQNHQGDLEIARKYIREFSEAGADAIKFQTRDNRQLFSECAYKKPYNSENAFADVYGLHREKLELSLDSLPVLKKDCHDHGVKFMSTHFDEPSLERLVDVGVDVLKIASFDIGNLPFIKKIAQANIPTVLSIGGGRIDQIRSSIELLASYCDEVAVLHCVSEYPCSHDKLGLNNIELLIKEFPECTVGLSDHFNGIVSGPIAYMKGARVFEKHVTFDRSWRGTDHSFALNHHGFRNFVRDIRRVPEMMPPKNDADLGSEFVFQKLGKSLVAAVDLDAGSVLTIDNLSGKIFNEQSIPVRESNTVIGCQLINAVGRGDLILRDNLK